MMKNKNDFKNDISYFGKLWQFICEVVQWLMFPISQLIEQICGLWAMKTKKDETSYSLTHKIVMNELLKSAAHIRQKIDAQCLSDSFDNLFFTRIPRTYPWVLDQDEFKLVSSQFSAKENNSQHLSNAATLPNLPNEIEMSSLNFKSL